MKKRIFIFSSIIVIVDQLIKLLAVNFLANKESITVINNFLSLTYVENDGAAWGILSGNRWFLIIISILAVYAIVKYFLLDIIITKMEFVGYSLLLGGIIGNLVNRIIYGYIVDYVRFDIFQYQFPVFNFADIAIVTGVGLITIHLIRNSFMQRRKK